VSLHALTYDSIQFDGLIRVLNEERELVFYCAPNLAERHIAAGEARAETNVLIWQGKPLPRAVDMVVEFGPGHSDGYEHYRVSIPVRFIERALEIQATKAHYAGWVLFERFRKQIPAIALLLEIHARLQVRKLQFGTLPEGAKWPYTFPV
jgi:hypothetical protein